jgi:putative oxidoreductase
MRTFLKTLPAMLLILLFVYAAFSKLLDFGDFRGQLDNQTFPHWLAGILLYALPLVELLAVTFLLLPKLELTGLILSLDLLLLFTGYIALVLLHFWNRVPCSCGGILSHMGWGTHLVFNSVFIGLNLMAIRIYFRDKKAAG